MRKTVVGFLAVAFIGGCTSTADVIAAWEGRTEGSLISSWGVPDRSYTSGGVKYLTFERTNTYGGVVATDTMRVDIKMGKILGGSCSGVCL